MSFKCREITVIPFSERLYSPAPEALKVISRLRWAEFEQVVYLLQSMSVYDALAQVSTFQEVHVEHPGVTRRSSVAVVIRYPGRKLRSGSAQQVLAQIKQLDATDSPEILFIKRAASERDRWSSHIALPGGRRDPEDKSDLDAAIRETSEEVGVDLIKDGVCIGPLDQFLVKVQWGTRV